MIEMIEQISIDLSNYCSKQCPFCYNHSRPEGATMWRPSEVIRLATDCIAHGVRAVSLGGGEPFEYDGVFDIIRALYPQCYLTVTTNGLPLEHDALWQRLLCDAPDKIHVTIHRPHDADEVRRVEGLIRRLAASQFGSCRPAGCPLACDVATLRQLATTDDRGKTGGRIGLIGFA